jgi:four helix bundle protein
VCFYPFKYCRRRQKNSEAEFGRYLSIATGSASEVEYYLLLANDLEIFDDKEYRTA